MNDKFLSRRTVLNRGLQATCLGLAVAALNACDQSEKVAACAGPNNLTFSENSLRQASHAGDGGGERVLAAAAELLRPGQLAWYLGI